MASHGIKMKMIHKNKTNKQKKTLNNAQCQRKLGYEFYSPNNNEIDTATSHRSTSNDCQFAHKHRPARNAAALRMRIVCFMFACSWELNNVQTQSNGAYTLGALTQTDTKPEEWKKSRTRIQINYTLYIYYNKAGGLFQFLKHVCSILYSRCTKKNYCVLSRSLAAPVWWGRK